MWVLLNFIFWLIKFISDNLWAPLFCHGIRMVYRVLVWWTTIVNYMYTRSAGQITPVHEQVGIVKGTQMARKSAVSKTKTSFKCLTNSVHFDLSFNPGSVVTSQIEAKARTPCPFSQWMNHSCFQFMYLLYTCICFTLAVNGVLQGPFSTKQNVLL